MEKNKIEASTLYLVATPLGNLDDITLRAIKALKECDFIAAEDTRVTAKLLSALGISGRPMITYEEHTKRGQGKIILEKLKSGQSCALVTDAGTPAISDPGEDLVKLCIENGIKVVPVPGACAAITALTVSGLSTAKFVFEGFLQGKTKQKLERLSALSTEERSVILYEAPHRLLDTLKLMKEAYKGDRKIAFCRELTKLNEEILRLPLSQAIAHFETNAPRGEFVLVIEGESIQQGLFWESLSVREHVLYYVNEMGLDKMSAVKATAKDRGLPKNSVYKELID